MKYKHVQICHVLLFPSNYFATSKFSENKVVQMWTSLHDKNTFESHTSGFQWKSHCKFLTIKLSWTQFTHHFHAMLSHFRSTKLHKFNAVSFSTNALNFHTDFHSPINFTFHLCFFILFIKYKISIKCIKRMRLCKRFLCMYIVMLIENEKREDEVEWGMKNQ